MSSALLFAFDSVPLAEFPIDSLAKKKKESLIYLASREGNEGRVVWDVIDKKTIIMAPLLDNIDMAALMEHMDGEFGSQNGLWGVDVEDPAHEKERTVVTLESPGIPGPP